MAKMEKDRNPAAGSDVLAGYKMLSTNHALTFREQFLSASNIVDAGSCHGSGSAPSLTTQPSPPRYGILKRETTRRILNMQDIIATLTERYNTTTTTTTPPFSLKVFAMENKTLAEQVEAMSEIDILIAPHGAALVHTIFLPKCAGVLELNPMGFEHPKFFGSLAALSSHTHATLYAGGLDKHGEIQKWSRGPSVRDISRRRDLCPNITLVMDAIEQLEEKWRTCCHRQDGMPQ